MATPLALVWELLAVDNASEVFSRVGKEAGTAAKETESLGSKFVGLGKIVGLAGLAMAVVSVKMAIDMQASTAKIAGNAQITQTAATKIGDAFLATAGKSTFSGKAMSDAFGPVAGVVQTLAGHTLTAADAMTVMNAATTLAEATGQPLAVTTGDLAAVMQNYGLKLKDAEEASNILFNTSRLTNVGLDTLTTTVDKLHGKLGIAAPTLTDVSALMVDLASHGVSGSKGLMVVNSGLTTLMGGSKSTTAELKTLGVHVFDTSGKFVGMKGVLEQLTPKLKDMTEQQRLAAEKALFGAGAARALDSTIRAGATGLEAATKAVEKHGAAESAAKAASQTLEGQMKTLKAGFADIVTTLGEKLIPVILNVVTWFEKHKTVAAALAVVIGGVLLAATIAWAASVIAATWPVLAIVVAIAAVTAGLVYCWQHFQTFRTVVGDVVAVIITIVRGLLKAWTTVIGGILGAAATIAEKLGLPFAKGLRDASNSFDRLAKSADQKLADVATSASHWGDATGKNYAKGIGNGRPAATAMAASVASSVKYALNVDTYSVGVAAARGFASGIRANTVLAVMAASSLAGQAQAAMAGAMAPPHRALGGPVTAGRAYIVGENRPELFVPSQSGTIVPKVPGGGGDNSDVVAAIQTLGNRFAVELNNQARTIQTMQRQMAGA